MMFVRVARAVFALAFALCGCVSSRIERAVSDAVAGPVAEQRFAGVVLVARDGRPLFLEAYGLADREQRIAHTPDMRFMIMSVSKQFTAVLIMRLAAAGALRLDDPVSRYLDHWPAEWNGVEIRHLLSHSSGLPIDATYFWLVQHHPEYWADPSSAPPPYQPAPLLAPPGTKYQYANIGYTLLSRIAAGAGGRPFDELIRDEVLRPLGLRHTQPERGSRVPGRARGYTRTAQGLILSEQKTIDIVGAGDLVSTAGDLARFDAAFDGDGFLPAALRQAMLAPHVRSTRDSLGYGWFLRTTGGGHALQYHAGDGAGFRAFNYRLPNERLAVVILCNIGEHDMPWIAPLVDRIADVVAQGAR
ncbi:MAG TPA: serine hydrolase domain-containing protein [Thermoanaerobaculia bacterium]|jgi:CubicO group peptidase (beta-lactamase class C family)